jgi:phenol 2-monooxygenase (NADPH)
MWEVAFWNAGRNSEEDVGRDIERSSTVPDVAVSARFPHQVTIDQGRVQRIFEDDLRRYSSRGVHRSCDVNNISINEKGDPEFPVLVDIEIPTGRRTVRTKYLIGADGAHSVVRKSMDLKLEGETSDFVCGVVDLWLKQTFQTSEDDAPYIQIVQLSW